MIKKSITVCAVFVLLFCAVPVLADESDATVTERIISDLYVSEINPPSTSQFYANGMVMIEGSDNYDLMQDYIEDPYHAEVPTEDDMEQIVSEGSSGKTLYLYTTYSYAYYSYQVSPGMSTSRTVETTQLLEATNLSFFVKEGDEFRIDIIDLDIHDSNSSYDRVYLHAGISQESLESGDDFESKFATNTVVSLSVYQGIATDITYDASGYSLPNGSSTVFAIAAIVVAAAILAILVMCGIQPRWAR